MEALRDMCQSSPQNIPIILNIKKLMFEKINMIYFEGDPARRLQKKSMSVIHHVGLFLVPQVKNLNWLPDDAKLVALEYIKDFIESIPSPHTPTTGITNAKFSKYMKRDANLVSEPRDELFSYMESDPVDMAIIKFWELKKNIYPKLYQLFLKIVCIPATSAASERAFSATMVIKKKKKKTNLIRPQKIK